MLDQNGAALEEVGRQGEGVAGCLLACVPGLLPLGWGSQGGEDSYILFNMVPACLAKPPLTPGEGKVKGPGRGVGR
jgi:hypothetical protein